MTEQQEVRKALDNHEWRDRWALLSALKTYWQDKGMEWGFGEVIHEIFEERDRMNERGEFDFPRFQGPEGSTHQFYAATLALMKKGF